MPLLYKPVQNQIASKDGKKKWRPTLVKFNKIVTTAQIAQELADLSAQSPGDVYNVFRNLAPVMKKHLLNSFSVNLEGLGTFTVIAKCQGNSVDTAEEVRPTQINCLRVQFTPTSTRSATGVVTRNMTDDVSFELYGSQSSLSHVPGAAGPGTGGGNDDGGNNNNDDGGGDGGGDDNWTDPSA